MTEELLVQRLIFYMQEIEKYKRQFPYMETFRRPMLGAADGIANFKLPPGNTMNQLNAAVEWLDGQILNNTNFSPEQKANCIYSVFDGLDLEISQSGGRQLLFMGDKQFFVNPNRYWKNRNAVTPLSSSSKSFASFGSCNLDGHSHFIKLGDITGDIGDPTSRMEQLNIGLFPLTNNFNIKWEYSKILNASRKTHGLYAKEVHNVQKAVEIDEIVREVIANNLHLICFPELMVDLDMQHELKEKFNKQYVMAGQLPFFMLIAGSFHESCGDHYKGKIPIIVYCHGQIFEFSYCKHEPFSGKWKNLIPSPGGTPDFTNFLGVEDVYKKLPGFLEEYGAEDIEHDPGITIIETEGFGKFGFAICKDVLPDQSLILKTYGSMIDHLVVLSLNYSANADFSMIAQQMSTKRHIGTLYTNARRYDPENRTRTFYQPGNAGMTEPIYIGDSDPFLFFSIQRAGPKGRRTI